MKNCYLLVALLVFTSCSCSARVPDTNRNRTVEVLGQDGSCTGYIIETGKVLTCGHCVDEAVTVNGNEAKVLKIDFEADLALLSVPTAKFSKKVIGKVRVGDEVYSWGHPMHSEHIVFTKGVVMDLDNGNLFTSIISLGGDSGSGVFNSRGELVGIVFAAFGDNPFNRLVSKSHDSEQIKKFLK